MTVEETRAKWAEGDGIRDAGLTIPEGIVRHLDLSYGPHGEANLLDVYLPADASEALPAIISIHGGGWVYGSKELYSHYCMRLALRGFAVVNFNYRLAPEHKYPAPLEDICALLEWVRLHGPDHSIDTENLFLLGDSAGGQLCAQSLAMLTNPEYAAMFSFPVPKGMKIRACALNCGCYFIPVSRFLSPKRMGALFEAYLPEDYMPIVPQLKLKKYITHRFPPAFVMSAQNDYLKFMAKPMYRLLSKKGVRCRLEIYGSKQQKEVGHVFHVNCKLPLAAKCNDDQCAFFRKFIVVKR